MFEENWIDESMNNPDKKHLYIHTSLPISSVIFVIRRRLLISDRGMYSSVRISILHCSADTRSEIRFRDDWRSTRCYACRSRRTIAWRGSAKAWRGRVRERAVSIHAWTWSHGLSWWGSITGGRRDRVLVVGERIGLNRGIVACARDCWVDGLFP